MKLSEGYDVFVVFMTDGRHALAKLGMYSGPAPFELRQIRREEAIKATRILGLNEEEVFFLDIEDGMLRNYERQAEREVVGIFRDVTSPREVYFPQEREYHVDHRATNSVIRKALARLDLHPIQYQYMVDLPFSLSLLRACSERISDVLMCSLLRCDLVHVNISDFLPLKLLALKEYRSQITLLSNEQRQPALKASFLRRFLKDEERFFVNDFLDRLR